MYPTHHTVTAGQTKHPNKYYAYVARIFLPRCPHRFPHSDQRETFCFLAVLVLALGICGVTTQFTVVNAFVLRGFSFPHPEQLMSVGLIDPQATPQNNNFGAGNIPSAQDYEDLRAAQRSFAQMLHI